MAKLFRPCPHSLHFMHKIPKIIHQIFYQGEAAIPENYQLYRQSVQKNHLDWEYIFWDETKCRILLEKNYSWFLPVYDAYPYWIQRCDAIRYFILDYYGGFYVDMDIECLKPIDNLLQNYELVVSKLIDFNNAIMGSIPHHPIWSQVFDELDKRKNTFFKSMAEQVSYTTGPMLFHHCIVAGKFEKNLSTRVCPGYIFEPGAPLEIDGKITKSKVTNQSYTIHHMSLKWLPWYHQTISHIFAYLTNLYWKLQ